ncbi:MAG: efflux RND transporter periplasmic adaptor subunit [Alphaproteobacteria bacterium]|nr:efflux RND transporter periplasmic adaptor subunit [Alphaproteobacteria bacterium]
MLEIEGAAAPAVQPRRRLGRTRLAVLAAAALTVLGLGGWALLTWYTTGRHHVSTNNAYVQADTTIVAAQVEGYVRRVAVGDNQPVRAGDVLVEIEPSDYEAALAQARAEAARARAEVQSNAANRAAADAQLRRSQYLADQGLLSSAGLDAARAAAGQWSGSTQASLAEVEAAQARIAAAQINLQRTIIRAPIDGVVGNRTVRVGQLLRSGAPLLAIVPDALYVEANFKETQLARMRAGLRAVVIPDIDRSMRIEGVVDSLSPASGSEFSFIPTETATGNFTKIVQRVPVRIRIEPTPAQRALLRPGLSATATVDLRAAD